MLELIELGMNIDEARISLQDVCVHLRRFGKTDAVAELVLENVNALKARYQSWASLSYGIGLNEAVSDACKRKKRL